MSLRLAVWWLTTVAWAAEIFYLSTATFHTGLSESLLGQLLSRLHISISPYMLRILNVVLRKSAHLVEYSIFSLLLYGSLRNDFYWRPRIASGCVIAAAAYALTDEFHQILAPGRGASLYDCGIDTIGGIIGMLFVYCLASAGNRKSVPPLR